MKKYHEKGRSMIEMLGVLAIIGVLSVGGIAGYAKTMMRYRVNKTIDQIVIIISNVRNLYANQRTFKDLMENMGDNTMTEQTKEIVQKAELVPKEMMEIDSKTGKLIKITNAFGGSVTLRSRSSSTFFLEFYNIPEEACISLYTYDWSSLGNVIGISHGINAYNITENCVTGSNNAGGIRYPVCTFPASITTAATACKFRYGAFTIVLKK